MATIPTRFPLQEARTVSVDLMQVARTTVDNVGHGRKVAAIRELRTLDQFKDGWRLTDLKDIVEQVDRLRAHAILLSGGDVDRHDVWVTLTAALLQGVLLFGAPR